MDDHAKAHSSFDGAHGKHHDHRKLYFIVFGALMLATVLTVLAAKVDVGKPGNVAIGVIIACVKVCLVGYIFMHLKDEARVFYAIALLPLILFLLIVFLLLPDIGLAEPGPLDLGPTTPAVHPSH